MRPRDRQAAITDLVRDRVSVSVDDLVTRFETSAETIRRDLAALARLGKVRKVHGGATLPRVTGEGPFAERMARNVEAKRQIARRAAALIAPGESLLVDTGSTTLVFAEELAGVDQLTLVTNSAEVARVVTAGNATARVFLLGGAYRGDNRQTCGTMALSQLQNFRVDRAVLTVGALDASGAMDFDPEEATMAQAMMRRAGSVMLLVDASKFNASACFAVCDHADVDLLVCDRAPQGRLGEALAANDVTVVC